MKEMKTITINGVTYTVADPDAATIDDSAVGGAAWSGKNIVDRLCPSFTESGYVVTCEPVAGYPLTVTSTDTTSVVTRCGKNLFDKSESKMKAVSWINENGTPSSEYWGYELILPPGTYTTHAEMASTYTEGYLYGQVCTLDGNRIREWHPVWGTDLSGKTAVFDQWVKVIIYSAGATIAVGANKPTSIILFNRFDIQIEAGSAATAFEPYSGGTFAPGDSIPALAGINTIWAESGTVTVTGRADPRGGGTDGI